MPNCCSGVVTVGQNTSVISQAAAACLEEGRSALLLTPEDRLISPADRPLLPARDGFSLSQRLSDAEADRVWKARQGTAQQRPAVWWSAPSRHLFCPWPFG